MRRGRIAAREPITRLLQDFVWNDRRLAERTDIRLTVNYRGELEKLPYEWHVFSEGAKGLRIVTVTEQHVGDLEINVNRQLEEHEYERLRLFAGLVAVFTSRSHFIMRTQVGYALKQIRESLNLSQWDIAEQAQASRMAVTRWESGEQAPSLESTYRWCQALGLVQPAGTALVRVVDLSPELLHFLREDPERIRTLSSEQFEHFVAQCLERMGFRVTLTGATNRKDGGIDLIAVPTAANLGSVVVAAQVKHHRGDRKTGRQAVDRLLAWKDSVFRVGLLVTNTGFTRDAIWKARREGNAQFLRLRDFHDLKRWLEGCFSEEDWREIPERIELAPGVVVEIPRPRIVLPSYPEPSQKA